MSVLRLPIFRRLSQNTALCAALVVLATFSGLESMAQVRVQGGFLADSIKIGEETAFYLSAKYPETEAILFPDSTYGFSPFEYARRKYFPTETTQGVSFDSAIYYITTFEVDRIQTLKLPVYFVNPQDCTQYFSNTDSIRLIHLVGEVSDSLSVDKLPLKENAAYHPVDLQFNYFLMLIVLGVLVLLAIVVWIFFGRRILRYLRARRMERKHTQFVQSYNSIVGEVHGAFSRAAAESALSAWKKYMEELEAFPYTKLTSRETMRLLRDESLGRNLSAIDNAIYGHGSGVVEPLQELKSVADHHFSKKLQEVKHGK
jgi:hypothetical protein